MRSRLLSVFVYPLVGLVMQCAVTTLDGTHAAPVNASAVVTLSHFIPPTTTTVTTSPATTAPPPKRADRGAGRVTAIPRPAPTVTAGQVNGYPCGGDLPPCWVLQRESRGNPNAVNPTGCVQYDPRTKTTRRGCYGLWQFSIPTWAGYAGVERAIDATVDQQNAKARLLWRGGRGCSHCSA